MSYKYAIIFTIGAVYMFLPAFAMAVVPGSAGDPDGSSGGYDGGPGGPWGGFIPLSGDDCRDAGVNCSGDDDAGSLAIIIYNIINAGLILVGVAALIVIIIGGIYYIISVGDSDKTEKAKKAILYAIIGLIIAALAYTIVVFVAGLLGAHRTGAGAGTGGSPPPACPPGYHNSADGCWK